MTPNAAIQLGLGYAWASEDCTHVPTTHTRELNGPFEFATAFAAGWADYNYSRRCNMIPVRDAYANWQASRGQSIFPVGDSTAEQRARHDEYRRHLITLAGKDGQPAGYLST